MFPPVLHLRKGGTGLAQEHTAGDGRWRVRPLTLRSGPLHWATLPPKEEEAVSPFCPPPASLGVKIRTRSHDTCPCISSQNRGERARGQDTFHMGTAWRGLFVEGLWDQTHTHTVSIETDLPWCNGLGPSFCRGLSQAAQPLGAVA